MPTVADIREGLRVARQNGVETRATPLLEEVMMTPQEMAANVRAILDGLAEKKEM